MTKQNWFAPPHFSDDDTTRKARILNILLWADAIIVLVMGVLLGLFPIKDRSWVIIGLSIASLVFLYSLRRLMMAGKVHLASEMLVLIIYFHVTASLIESGTTRTPVFSSYLLIVVCAGLLLKRRALISTALLCITTGSILIYAEIAGPLRRASLLPPLNLVDWLVFSFLLVYAAAFILLIQSDINSVFGRMLREAEVRRRAEDALRGSSEFFNGIFNGLDDPVIVKDAHQRWVMVNDGACTLMGRSRQDLLGRRDDELYPPDISARYGDQERQVLETGMVAVFEEKTVVEGEERTHSIKKSRFTDQVSGEKFIAIVVHDITARKIGEERLARSRDDLELEVAARVAELNEANQSLQREILDRKQAEDALRRSMDEMLTFMDVTPGVVFMIDEDGRMVRWNRQLIESVGYSPEELGQMTALDLIYDDDRPAAEEMVNQAMREGKADIEMRVCSRDGQVTLYYIAGARIEGKDGVHYFAGVGVDITSLFVAEEALRESEGRFRSLVEAIPDIVLVSDFSGHMLYTTPSLERQTGLTLPDLQTPGENLSGIPVSEESNGLQQAIQEFVQNDHPYSSMIVNQLVGKDNQLHWYSSILSRVQYRGEPALQVVSRDITEQKRAEEALYRSQERLRALLDATTDSTFLIGADGTFLAVNEATARTYGLTVDELVGKNGFDGLLEEIADSRADLLRKVVQTGKPIRFEDYGLSGWSDNNMFPIFSAAGQVEAVAVFSRDITEQKLAEEALRESEERYALAARGANDGLWDLNLRNNLIYLSPRWKSMIGLAEEESREPIQNWLDNVHHDDRDRMLARMSAHLQGSMPHFECEFRLRHADGTFRWVLTRGLAVRDETGKAYRVAGSMTDISENKRISDQLLHDALHDALTGLPNRGLLTDRLEQAIERRKRYNDFRYALLFLDLDGFKDINDSYSHNTGDKLLIAAAQRMKLCLRAVDTLARLSGDEFVILQTSVSGPADATRLAARLLEELSRPFVLDGNEIPHTSASIGIVLGDELHNSPEDILRDADIAMYQAKYHGKACYQVFDESMRNQVQARVRMESELRNALVQGELDVYYHPIISLKDGRFTGFEALARWRHPTRGLIPPADFISLAENCRLVIPLDRWVLREACRQVKEWQSRASVPMKVSVNLSGRHFPHADLVEAVQEILRDTGLAASDLVVEITESAFMENIEMAKVTLKGLTHLGVGVEFDDFGKGYSSLNYLREMPVDTLKIDSSFIRQIDTDKREADVVQAIIQLGHILNLNVVAEGVETHEQLKRLIGMGCDFAQGYYFALPLEPSLVMDWIAENSRDLIT